MHRNIKIEYRNRARRWGYTSTAKIMLSGHWLQAAGFAPGQVAHVQVEAGRLIITPAPVQ